MASPKIYYRRLTDYTLSATLTNASFPLDNLKTYFKDDQWKSTATTVDQQLAVDFGAAVSLDSIIVENHNILACAADIGTKLQGADDAGFTSGLVTLLSDILTIENPGLRTFAATSKRYWRILYNSSAPLSAIPEIGNLFLCSSFDFGQTYEFPYKAADPSFVTSIRTALDGRLRSSQSFPGRYVFELSFELLDDTVRAAFISFMNTTRGRLYPFYFADADAVLYYVHNDADYKSADVQHYQLNNIAKLRLIEQLAERS